MQLDTEGNYLATYVAIRSYKTHMLTQAKLNTHIHIDTH